MFLTVSVFPSFLGLGLILFVAFFLFVCLFCVCVCVSVCILGLKEFLIIDPFCTYGQNVLVCFCICVPYLLLHFALQGRKFLFTLFLCMCVFALLFSGTVLM